MKAYHKSGSSSWSRSQDRDFNEKTEHAQKLCDYINSLEHECRIGNASVAKIIKEKSTSYIKTRKLLQILVNHGKLKKRLGTHSVDRLYFCRKEGIFLKPEWVEEASEY